MKEKKLNSEVKDYILQLQIIDLQHKAFFDIYNNSLSLLSANRNHITENDILEIIHKLTDYMKVHFKTEEDLLMRANYPDIDKHIKEHIYYIDKIDEFTAAFKYRNPTLLDNMLVFMKKWFISHIKKTDAKYIAALKEFIEKNS